MKKINRAFSSEERANRFAADQFQKGFACVVYPITDTNGREIEYVVRNARQDEKPVLPAKIDQKDLQIVQQMYEEWLVNAKFTRVENVHGAYYEVSLNLK